MTADTSAFKMKSFNEQSEPRAARVEDVRQGTPETGRQPITEQILDNHSR